MIDFDEKAFEDYIRDDLEGRLYWEDLMERVIQGRVDSAAFKEYNDDFDERCADTYSEAYDEGWESGWNEGKEEAASDYYDDGYSEGYEQGWEDAKNGREKRP